MRAYVCQRHGDYNDADYPVFVSSAWCDRCSHERLEASRFHQTKYEDDCRAWESWRRNSGIHPRGLSCTLENWHPRNKAQEIARRVAERWSSGISNRLKDGRGLTLLGPPGVGKTHLCYALITKTFESRNVGRYAIWSDVIDRQKATFRDQGSRDSGLVDELKCVPVLVLDEIGIKPATEFEQLMLFGIIDARYRNLRPTIIATNLSIEMLGSVGEPTLGRLVEMNTPVTIPGDSQRGWAADNCLIEAAPAMAKPQAPVIPFEVSINGQMVSMPIYPLIS